MWREQNPGPLCPEPTLLTTRPPLHPFIVTLYKFNFIYYLIRCLSYSSKLECSFNNGLSKKILCLLWDLSCLYLGVRPKRLPKHDWTLSNSYIICYFKFEKNNKIIASRKFQKELLSHSKEKGKSLKPKIVPANFPRNFCRVGLKLSSGVLGATSAICLVGFATATDVPDKLKSKHHATFGGPASPGFATCKAPNSWPVTQLI